MLKVVSSANGRIGLKAAMDVLKKGGTALDAVEVGCRVVESNPEDRTVGYGGLPNLIGEVELDASIMDGDTLAAGAVGAVKRFEHPISIARKVMEELPHVMLVGEGAERFAREMGFQEKNLLTLESRAIWEKGLKEHVPGLYEDRMDYLDALRKYVRLAADPEKHLGTVNFIAKDRYGRIACGVSTSGWAWKYPGRLGDSPIIGAGNYADSRYGAAACTGRGEMTVRLCTARSIVLYMASGMSLDEAARKAMKELLELSDPYWGRVSCIVMDREGNHGAYTVGGPARYAFITDEMDEPEELPRIEITREG